MSVAVTLTNCVGGVVVVDVVIVAIIMTENVGVVAALFLLF